MSESITKTLVGVVAVAVLFWVFWNPAPETEKSKTKTAKTEQASEKPAKRKPRNKKDVKKRIAEAKKRAAGKPSKTRASRRAPKKLTPPEGSAAFLVTGNVKAVRLRGEDGTMFGPGFVEPGRYQILSRGADGIKNHGHIVFEEGDRKRIDCNDDVCSPWEPKER